MVSDDGSQPAIAGDDDDDGGGGAESGPRVWLLVGEKRGDNAQVRNLACALGWPFAEKAIRMKPAWVDGKPPVSASLDHVDRAASDPLEGPWPDLLITAGRRLASVALFIKRASKGRTRVVVIGKPRGRLDDFDLIVAAAHYVLPERPNVVRHALPLMAADEQSLSMAASAWATRLASFARPLVALFVGGPTGGLRLDEAVAARMLEATRAFARERKGSLYIVTSRRTPDGVNDFLRAARAEGEALYVYDEKTPPEDNPYQALLGSADAFVVTMDSLSMMVEVARRGSPLQIVPLDRKAGGIEALLPRLDPRVDSIPAGGVGPRTLAALGWPIHSRDLSAIARRLVAGSHASWLGDPAGASEPFEDEELAVIAERIRALVRP